MASTCICRFRMLQLPFPRKITLCVRWFNFDMFAYNFQEMKLKLNALTWRWEIEAPSNDRWVLREKKKNNNWNLFWWNNWKQSMLLRILFVLVWHCLAGSHANKTQQKILSIEANCTRDLMHIKINMDRPFKGMVFAKGFNDECGSAAGELSSNSKKSSN